MSVCYEKKLNYYTRIITLVILKIMYNSTQNNTYYIYDDRFLTLACTKNGCDFWVHDKTFCYRVDKIILDSYVVNISTSENLLLSGVNKKIVCLSNNFHRSE